MAVRNVLYVAPSVGIGGVETFLKHVSQYHSASYQPFFLLFENGPLGHWLEANEATVFYCRNKPRLSQPWTWWNYRSELLNIIKSNNIELVHSSMAYGALFTWPAATRVPHVWFQHGPVSGWMDALAYALPSHAVLYNSEYSLRRQLAVNWKDKSKGDNDIIIPLGTPEVDATNSTVLKQENLRQFQLAEGTFIISMACRLQRWKGVHIAMEAVTQLLKRVKRPIAFLVYGDDTWDPQYAKELKEMASGLPIYFSKPVTDIASVFLSSDIVINASTTPEPFGFTVIEAMACGALAIAPRSGGTEEILRSLPECLFAAESASDLCAKILPMIENHEHFLLAKSRSHDLFENSYTVETMMGHLENCYNKVLS